ncbi:MAG: tetratricopeptide repeat protein [Bulleidia sp.]
MNELQIEAKDLNQQAALLMKSGNLDAAKAKLDKAIEIDPMTVESYRNYGDYYMAKNQYQDAKNSYKKAMLIKKDGLFHFLYGNACFMNDEVHEGLEHYNLAISEGYDTDEMMYFTGMAYEHLNDDRMALRFFSKACAKNPSRPDFTFKKIQVMFRLNMVDEAEKALDNMLVTSPELFDIYHLKTHLLLQKKNYTEAVEFAKMASEKFPEDVDLLGDYARAVGMNGDYQTSLKLIEQAKQMKYFEDSKRDILLLEAQVAAESGDSERAIACCDECVSFEEEQIDSEARFMIMNLKLAKKDYSGAFEQASAMISKDSGDLYYYAALYYRAFCAKALGKEDAQKFYSEANSIFRLETLNKPQAVDIYLYRAMCLKDMEQYDKALEMLDFIMGLNVDMAEIHMIRADIYRTIGKNGLANDEMNKAYELKPELKKEDE